MKYYIKERHNPQTGVYYTALGKMPATKAKASENTLYGCNYVYGYSKSCYLAKCEELGLEPELQTNGE